MFHAICLSAAISFSAPAPKFRPKPAATQPRHRYAWGSWEVTLSPGGGLLMRYPGCVYMGVSIAEAYHVGVWKDEGEVIRIEAFEAPHGSRYTRYMKRNGGLLHDTPAPSVGRLGR